MRFLPALGVAVACAAATVSAQTPAPRPAPATQKAAGGTGASTARKYVVGRTPWGDPDLQGNWNNKQEVNTPLERPDEWAGKRISDISEKELADAVVERQRAQVLRYENIIGVPIHWIDRLDSQNSRPWFVIDPPDGKIPPRTEEGKKRADAVAAARKGRGTADSYTDRGLWDRCASRGPGVTEMQPKVYGNSYQILQSKDYVAIRYEMIHETRLIPIEGRGAARAHISPILTSVYGDATARWDGNTLVVDTVNYNGKTAFQGSNEGLHTIEDRWKPDLVGVEHRTAAIRGETVPCEIDDVDVARPQRNPLLEHPCAFVDERVDRPIENLRVADGATPHAGRRGRVFDQREDFRIWRRFAVFAIAIPPLASLLAEPPHLDQLVGDKRLARARLLELMQLLPDTPGHIDARHVVDGENAHRHAPVGEDAVDLLR